MSDPSHICEKCRYYRPIDDYEGTCVLPAHNWLRVRKDEGWWCRGWDWPIGAARSIDDGSIASET